MPELTPRQLQLVHAGLSSMLSNIDDFNDALEVEGKTPIEEREVLELLSLFPDALT